VFFFKNIAKSICKTYTINMNNLQPEKLPLTRQEFSRLKIFHNVCYESIAGYLLHSHIETFDAGTTLISPDNSVKRLIVLLKGELEIQITSDKKTTINTIEEGNCVGEISIFDNSNPSAWVRCSKKSSVLIIPGYTILAMLHASHDLCLNFLHLLSQRVRYSNEIVRDNEFHIRCIEEASKIDSLTSLHNRRWLQEMYSRELKRSHAGNFKLCALMLDIDHFKAINDTHGHIAGDSVLVQLASILNESLRPSDMPVRFGGEEFSVFLPGTHTDNAKVIAERIRKNMEKNIFILPNQKQVKITVSIGFAKRESTDTVESLIEKADQALYYAKENGRNKVAMYLEKGEFFLF